MAYTEFYVTKGSSAANTNGGGPSLGTNDGPVVTRTNCASNGAGTTITDSDGTGWSGASTNDWLCFDTAGVKEFTRITNIAGNDLTVSPAVSVSLSGKTVNVGGAWATLQHAANTVTTSFVVASTSPPRVNIKYSATDYDETVDFNTNAGTNAVTLRFEGYETTAGDRCPNGNLPHINNSSAAANAGVLDVTRANLHIAKLRLTTTVAAQEAVFVNATEVVLDSLWCKATGAGANGIELSWSATNGTCFDCYIEDSAADGFAVDGSSNSLLYCVSLSAGATGFDLQSAAVTVVGCIASGASADGFAFTSVPSSVVLNCVANSCGGDGFEMESATIPLFMANCICSSITGVGVKSSAALGGVILNCAFYNCGTDVDTDFYMGTIDKVALSGDPFTNAASGDFSLNNTSGAGAACRSAGFPGALLDGTNVGYADIGALRHQDPAGGSGGPAVMFGE